MSYEPTHRVSAAAPTWPAPDRSQPAGPELYAGLEVQVLEDQGDLSKVLCDNGWEAWVDRSALSPLVAAPSGPPPAPDAPSGPPPAPVAGPPPAPVAATPAAPPPPPPVDTPTTVTGQQPPWLKPALIVGAAVVLIAIVVAISGGGGDSGKKKAAGGSETVVTEKAPKLFDAARVFPSPGTFASADGGNWQIAGFVCRGPGAGPLTGGEDCEEDDIDDFNFLCNDEFLGGTVSQQRKDDQPESVASEEMFEPKRFLSVDMQSRVYETKADAQRALKEVSGYYTGPCQSYEPGPTIYTPIAVAEADHPLGDDYIAFVEIDTAASEDQDTDHVWVQTGRVLFSFEVSRGSASVAENFYRDLAQTVVANARAANAKS